jgi:hypothetical protein
MKPRLFAALAAAAALTLAAALIVYSASAPWTTSGSSGGKLLPGFAETAGKTAKVVISQGGKQITLEKAGDAWRLADRDGYPASTDKVRALLVALSEANLAEPKTQSSDRYRLLEVEDPAGKDANARLVTVKDESGATLAEVIAGKERPGQAGTSKGGTYVRKPGDPQSWLADQKITGGIALRDWVNVHVYETPTEKVSRLGVEVKGEPPYEIKRNAGGTHELQDIPAGKKVKYVNVIDTMIEAASFLDLENVRKATASTEGEAGTLTLETDSGLRIVMKIRRDKDGAWATLTATGEGDAKKSAADIAARADGWEFELMPSKANTLLKKRDEFLEDANATSGETAPGGPAPDGAAGFPAIPGLGAQPPVPGGQQ